MNGRKARQLRQQARDLTTVAGEQLKGVRNPNNRNAGVTAVHALGSYRRVYQDLKHGVIRHVNRT